MAQFIQVILINLAVSCDNVGVIALATRNLAPEKAVLVRRIGIGLSLVLKIIFIAIIGSLLQVTWLHIRIIGGLMLLYVTFQMLNQHDQEQTSPSMKEINQHHSFRSAIIAIVAADISMSLDNVVAILGVVSSDASTLGTREYLLIVGSLVVCLPLLLWFSGTIAKLMERFPILTCLCAGYLVYTAITIIMEDESIKLFLAATHFDFAKPAAILCGILMTIYGILSGRSPQTQKIKRGTLLLYVGVVISALLTVGGLSYLNTASLPELDAEFHGILFGKLQSGFGAVHLLGMESEILCLCAALLAGMHIRYYSTQSTRTMLINMRRMAVFILLYLTVTTVGLTYTFGLGDGSLLGWIVDVSLIMALLLTYPAAFGLLAVLTRNRFLTVLLSLLYLFVESVITAVCMTRSSLLPVAGLFPKFYLSTYSMQPLTPVFGLRILLIACLYIGFSLYLVRFASGKRVSFAR